MGMESQGSPVVENSQTSPQVVETPAPQSTPEPQSNSQAPSQSVTSGNPQAQPSGVPQWTPNFKYKAGGEEKELPEWVRSSIKSQEHEKYLREMHEKIDGFDKLKSTHTKVESQFKQILPEYQTLRGTVEKVLQFRESGDIEGVMELIGIPKQAVAKWMLKELQIQDMTPEQRAVYDNERQLRQQNMALQDRVAALSQSAQQGEMQARAVSLHTELVKPEVKMVADSFNARMANPDAFWNLVCQQAENMERVEGRSVSASEAVQYVVNMLGKPVMPGQAQSGLTQSGANGVANPNPPVIPNVAGRSHSPTKKLARSLDDLRKMAKEMSS